MRVAHRRGLHYGAHHAAGGNGAGMTTGGGSRIHERWAQLRFSVIGHLLSAPPAAGTLRGELKKLAARQWRHPGTGEPVRFGVSTIERWLYRARRERYDPVKSASGCSVIALHPRKGEAIYICDYCRLPAHGS
jgi:hypothetical protein